MTYYVVLIGRRPGIYETWDEVVGATHNFIGADYRSCNTLEEAKEWYGNQTEREVWQTNQLSRFNVLQCYVDGSFLNNRYSYAFACVKHGEVFYHQSGMGDNHEAATILHSQSGELKSAMQACLYAAKNGYKHVILYHDNESIQGLMTGRYAPKNIYTAYYIAFMNYLKTHYGLTIDFTKVKGHRGNPFNDFVDRLSRETLYQAIGKWKKCRKKQPFANDPTNIRKPNLTQQEIRQYLVETAYLLERNPTLLPKKRYQKYLIIQQKFTKTGMLTGRERYLLLTYCREMRQTA